MAARKKSTIEAKLRKAGVTPKAAAAMASRASFRAKQAAKKKG